MTPAKKDEGPAAKGYGEGYEYFGMALNFTVAILLFGAGGWLLDGWVHTRPLFAIVGAFVGGVAGFMSLYYRVRKETDGKGR
jgi:F0F1-type ATP synthase assembly protein I